MKIFRLGSHWGARGIAVGMAVAALACANGGTPAGPGAANGSSGNSHGNGSGGNGMNAAGSGASGFPFPGALDVQVDFPVGIAIERWQYQVSGLTTAAGTVQPPNAGVRTFHVASVAPGWGSVTIMASSVDGTLACTGTAPFILAAGMSDEVDVAVGCRDQAADGGTLPSCPRWQSIQVTPGEVPVGRSAQLTFFATGPSPRTLQYAVNAEPNLVTASPTSGVVSMTGGATTVTCTAAGVATLQVTFSDGPVPGGGMCSPDLVMASVSLQCDPAGDASAPIGSGAISATEDADAPDRVSSDTVEDADAVQAADAEAAPTADAEAAPTADAEAAPTADAEAAPTADASE
jgi:hypothetical protein